MNKNTEMEIFLSMLSGVDSQLDDVITSWKAAADYAEGKGLDEDTSVVLLANVFIKFIKKVEASV